MISLSFYRKLAQATLIVTTACTFTFCNNQKTERGQVVDLNKGVVQLPRAGNSANYVDPKNPTSGSHTTDPDHTDPPGVRPGSDGLGSGPDWDASLAILDACSQSWPDTTLFTPGLATQLSADCRTDNYGPIVGPTCIKDGAICRSFGHVVFYELCMRISNTSPIKLDPIIRMGQCNQLKDPKYQVSSSEPAKLLALHRQYENIKKGIDGMFPNEYILNQFNRYLKAITGPLIDSKLIDEVTDNLAVQMMRLSAQPEVTQSMARISHLDAFTPSFYQGVLARQMATAKALPDFAKKGVNFLMSGTGVLGSSHTDAVLSELAVWQTSMAEEMRHLKEGPTDPNDPKRNSLLLRNLMFSKHPALTALADKQQKAPLWIAARDYRAMPVFNQGQLQAPYTAIDNTQTQFSYFLNHDGTQYPLAQADKDAFFTSGSNLRIALTTPFARASVLRTTESGKVYGQNGQPLFLYDNINDTLLMALLEQARPLFVPVVKTDNKGTYTSNILGGLLRTLKLASGNQTSKARPYGYPGTYQGFASDESLLLDMAYVGSKLALSLDVDLLLQGARQLIDEPVYETSFARSFNAFVKAADELKKPTYDNASLDNKSTLIDDMMPILSRMMLAEPGLDGKSLLEDVASAMQHKDTALLGPMIAQLMDERSYFFMRQPTKTELKNKLNPTGVVGQFGYGINRSMPDADATMDWSNYEYASSDNNRSAWQRLLHMVADANGTTLCNGRNATFLGGAKRFEQACDLLKLDNVAPFFLLSIASKELRQIESTGAKSAANFRDAILNGNVCRDNPQGSLCNELKNKVADDGFGDRALEGLMGINQFGRYPDAAVAARVLFLDLGDPQTPLDASDFRQSARGLLYNFKTDGSVDADDPNNSYDNRAYVDSMGRRLSFIGHHNGVLFALEQVRAQNHATKNFYDALRPLVDAFAKHAESRCLKTTTNTASGVSTCVQKQNGVQILADLMSVLHRHWPSAQSQRFGQTFADTYGTSAIVDGQGLVSFEPFVAYLLDSQRSDFWPAIIELLNATQKVRVGEESLTQIVQRLGRLMLTPRLDLSLTDRQGQAVAWRRDGALSFDDRWQKSARAEPTLQGILGFDPRGRQTLFGLLKQTAQTMGDRFNENPEVATIAKRAVSDLIDQYAGIDTVDTEDCHAQRFKNRQLMPMASILMTFMQSRLNDHRTTGLSDYLKDVMNDLRDFLDGPVFSSTFNLLSKIDQNDDARKATYALLSELLDPSGDNLYPLALFAADGLQLMTADSTMRPLLRALAPLLDRDGPIEPALRMAKVGQNAAAMQGVDSFPFAVINNAFQSQCVAQTIGVTPVSRLGDATQAIHRSNPQQTTEVSAADVSKMLNETSDFMLDWETGLKSILDFVRNLSK